MTFRSAIYTGTVMHGRRHPVDHVFRSRVMFWAIDLDEVTALEERLIGFSSEKRNVLSLRAKDHIGDPTRTIKQNLLDWLNEQSIDLTEGRIVMVGHIRQFGFVFNPITVFYCYWPDDRLACIVAEVANTFGERYCYLLDPQGNNGDRRLAFRQAKRLHVSPFFGMDQRYEFAFSEPGERIAIRVDVYEGDERVFRATQTGRRHTISNTTVAWMLIRYPLMSWRVAGRIHLEAVRLWRKGLPFHYKPPFDPEQGTLMTTAATLEPPTDESSPPHGRRLRPLPTPRRTPVGHGLERLFVALLDPPVGGRIRLRMPSGRIHRLGTEGPEATLTITSRDAFHRVATRGRLGIGEGYQAGDWYADDLPLAIAILARSLEGVRQRRGFSEITRLLALRPHIARENGLGRAKEQIQYHYDLGNDLYRLFLDDTWSYSCAIFERPDETLEEAQTNKLRRMCEKLALTADDHVLEIGCGWGGFAEHAAAEWGARVTGVTLSEEQHAFATERIRAAGLADRVTILLQDYRTLGGQFSKIASIEMFEAIGDREFGRFFATCDRLLAPDGWAAIQTIAVPDQKYERYRRGKDWIREHIFPGAVIPSLEALSRAMTKSSSLIVQDVENIGVHYAETLRRWRMRFLENRPAVLALGFDDVFIRTWEFYLAFCEAAFATRAIQDYQVVLSRPMNQRLPV